MHEEHALQMFLSGGSAELLFSRMSTGHWGQMKKETRKLHWKDKKKWSLRIVFFSQSDDFSAWGK